MANNPNNPKNCSTNPNKDANNLSLRNLIAAVETQERIAIPQVKTCGRNNISTSAASSSNIGGPHHAASAVMMPPNLQPRTQHSHHSQQQEQLAAMFKGQQQLSQTKTSNTSKKDATTPADMNQLLLAMSNNNAMNPAALMQNIAAFATARNPNVQQQQQQQMQLLQQLQAMQQQCPNPNNTKVMAAHAAPTRAAPTQPNPAAAVMNPLNFLHGMNQLGQLVGLMNNNMTNTANVANSKVKSASASHSTTPVPNQNQVEAPIQAVSMVSNNTISSISGSSGGAVAHTLKAPPPKVTSSDRSSKEETLPQTIILPCRARGMPVDHNFRSAHFVIPHSIRHGEDLVCSYEECRNAGNKFRYCSECRIPVAKRNFHQRHGHGLACVTTTEAKAPRAASATASAPKKTKKKSKAAAAAARAGATKLSKKRNCHLSQQKQKTQDQRLGSSTDSSSDASQERGQKRRKTGSAAALASSNSDIGPTYPEVGDIPLARQLRWATLLGKRPDPDDADGMSQWLLEVMSVSDLKTSLANFASSSLTNSGSGESDIFGGSNSDSPEMGSSVNSSLSTDVLTSDVSSEEALQDSRNPETSKPKALTAAESERKMPAKTIKSSKDRQKQQKESKKDAGKAVRRQEKKRKAQKGREDKEKRKNKKRRSYEMEYDHSGEKKSKSKKSKSIKSRDPLQAAGLSESQVKLVQDENAKIRQEDLSNDSPDNEDLSASYAEWQERKKQKALNKAESPVNAPVAATAAAP
ncbi:MAG: hypothetical protein SGILL_004868 [Bacillariaceae sp.]